MGRKAQTQGEKIYKELKKNINKSIYEEKKHCAMVIDVLGNPEKATMASFCIEAGISDKTFYKWINKYDIFHECYRYACMLSQQQWDNTGKNGMYDEDFNIEVWKVQGAARYGVGKTNRVRVHIDADTSPFEQYKQLMAQASNGDFSSSELKQLMESINIGCRAYEQFELQKEIDVMKTDLKKMSQNNADNIRPIESFKKTN